MKNIRLGRARAIASALIILASFTFASGAFAQYQQQPGSLFGENHYYTVLFRGNGEAIVFVKFVFTNTGTTPLTNFAFEVPEVTPREMLMFQQKLPRVCNRYDYSPTTGQKCASYSDPDYNGGYYGEGQAEYQKITYKQIGSAFDLTLPFPVAPNKSTAVVISYSGFGYVTKSLGHFAFDFETVKVPERISQARVTINVDADLVIKNPETTVNYQSGFGAVPSSAELAGSKAIASPALDNIVRQIGSYGQITKTAQGLAANETFTVSGEYATSWFWLYFSSILWIVGIIAVIIVASYFIARRRARRGMATSSSDENFGTNHSIFDWPPAFLIVVTSFISALLVVLISFLVEYISEMSAWRNLIYGNSSAFALLISVMVLVLYIFALFGPAVLLGSKRGVRYGVYAFAGEFVWLALFLIMYLVLFSGNVNPPIYYGGPVPMMEGVKTSAGGAVGSAPTPL